MCIFIICFNLLYVGKTYVSSRDTSVAWESDRDDWTNGCTLSKVTRRVPYRVGTTIQSIIKKTNIASNLIGEETPS